jgi:hypothetical protein
MLQKCRQDTGTFLLCSLTCSQIWLSPLVDDHQTTYLTKLGKKILFKLCPNSYKLIKSVKDESLMQQEHSKTIQKILPRKSLVN